MAKLTYKVTNKREKVLFFLLITQPSPYSLPNSLFPVTNYHSYSSTIAHLISNKTGSLCPSFAFWMTDVSCCMTYVWTSPQRALGSTAMNRSSGDTGDQGRTVAISYYFVSSHTIKPDPNCAHVLVRSHVINFVFHLVWAFHRTVESLNQLCWNGLLGTYSLLRAGSKGQLKVRINSWKVRLLYWPQMFSSGLQKTPINPVFGCMIDLLATWRE